MTKKLLRDIVSSSAQPPPLKPRTAQSLISRVGLSSNSLARSGGDTGSTGPRDAKTDKSSPRL